jgi:sugar porter (SP) family MFS transporter
MDSETLDSVLPKYGFGWIKVPFLRKLNALLFISMLASTNNGYDGSMLNGLQSMETWRDYFNHPTGQHLGTLSNGMLFGGIACYPIAPWVCDTFGRRFPIAMGCVLIIIGSTIQACAQNYAMFLGGRMVLGFGSGFCTAGAPLLLSETSYPEHRFILTAIYNTLNPFGAMLAAWLTLGTSFINSSSWSWRTPCLFQGFLPLVMLTMVYFVPESPRYLIYKERYSEARKLLVEYHAGGDEASVLVDFEMAEISTAIELEKIAREYSYLDFFKTKGNRYRLFLLVMVAANTQLSGNALISYYLNLVLDSIGIVGTHPQLYVNAGLQIYSFVLDIIFACFVERAGRRKMFLFSFSGMLTTFIIWTVLSALGQQETPQFFNKNLSNGVLAMIFICSMFYGSALQGLPFLYFTEILPYQLRAKGLNVAQVTMTICSVFNGYVNPIALEKIDWHYYIVWCCVLACFLTIAYFFYPETRGRSLETVREVFGEDVVHVSAKEGEKIGRNDLKLEHLE